MRWLIPAIYFLVSQFIYLLYELWIADKMIGVVGVIAALMIVVITFPARPIAIWAQNQAATSLGFAQTDSIGYHSFWPRFIGVQSSILTCTLALLAIGLVIHQISEASKGTGNGSNP